MLVKIEARILIFPGTDFHFPSTSSVPLGTFLGSAAGIASGYLEQVRRQRDRVHFVDGRHDVRHDSRQARRRRRRRRRR